MLKWSSTARVMAIGLCLLGTPAAADTLPLPQNLIDFTSEQGEHLLLNAEAKAAYWPLAAQFVTQEHQAYCGVASLVMVMNALRIPAPTTPEFTPYSAFTQGDFLNDATEKILPRAVLAKQGMTLDQIARLAETYPVRAEIHHASDTDLDEFRTMAISHLQQKDHFILVNYLRRAIGEERGGHISPLAAYDADADRFLILDVSRYKYPPVWVTASDLFDAMNTADSDNDNRTRGTCLSRPVLHNTGTRGRAELAYREGWCSSAGRIGPHTVLAGPTQEKKEDRLLSQLTSPVQICWLSGGHSHPRDP